jgi:hypothetical protein
MTDTDIAATDVPVADGQAEKPVDSPPIKAAPAEDGQAEVLPPALTDDGGVAMREIAVPPPGAHKEQRRPVARMHTAIATAFKAQEEWKEF